MKYLWHDTTMELGFQPIRLEYELTATETIINPITDRLEPYIPPFKRLWLRTVSALTTLCLILIVLAALVFIISFRVWLMVIMNQNVDIKVKGQKVDRLLAAIISATVSAVVIIIFEKCYRCLAWSKF